MNTNSKRAMVLGASVLLALSFASVTSAKLPLTTVTFTTHSGGSGYIWLEVYGENDANFPWSKVTVTVTDKSAGTTTFTNVCNEGDNDECGLAITVPNTGDLLTIVFTEASHSTTFCWGGSYWYYYDGYIGGFGFC